MSSTVIGCAMKVHSVLGPGLLESAYEACLCHELAKAVVELMSVERLLPIHESQLLTYLRLTGLPAAILINFNVRHLRDGLRRRVGPT